MSIQLSYMPQLRLGTALGTGVWLSWGASEGSKGNGKQPAQSAALPAQPGRASEPQLQIFIICFPKSAHMEPSNILNDISVATREGGGA